MTNEPADRPDRALLLEAGHSMAKTMEIELDTKRGEPYATSWLAAQRNLTQGETP